MILVNLRRSYTAFKSTSLSNCESLFPAEAMWRASRERIFGSTNSFFLLKIALKNGRRKLPTAEQTNKQTIPKN